MKLTLHTNLKSIVGESAPGHPALLNTRSPDHIRLLGLGEVGSLSSLWRHNRVTTNKESKTLSFASARS